MVAPSLAELRARCDERGIQYTATTDSATLITLLTPNANDHSLDAAIERDFLGLELEAPSPFPMLPRHLPPGAPLASRTSHKRTNVSSPVRLFNLDA